jgi:hypothetical protein
MEDAKTIEQRCTAEWERNQQIRGEFLKLGDYIAYEKATAQGLVRILGGTVRS